MKEHSPVAKGKGSKNINIARNVGIAISKSWFKDMLDIEMQGAMFSWDNDSIPMVESSLFMYYKTEPKNIEELKKIAFDAAKIEFNNLKEEYLNNHKELPIKRYSDEDSIRNFVRIFTINHVMVSQTKFYAEKKELKVDDLDTNWKKLYLEEITVNMLKDSAIKKAEVAFIKKASSNTVINETIKQINNYYDNITDLSSMLYSSR